MEAWEITMDPNLRQASGEDRRERNWPRLFGDHDNQTQTIDLDPLFSGDVTESGSFDLTRVKYASFGKLLQALSVATLLINRHQIIEFANRAFSDLSGEGIQVVGKPFSSLFSDPRVARKAELLVQKVFQHRNPEVQERVIKIHGRKIWARIHLRTIRLGRDRLMLVQIENLTAEKQLLMVEKYRKLVNIFPIGMAEFATSVPLSLALSVAKLVAAVTKARIVDGNDEFASLYKRRKISDLHGVPLGTLFPFKGRGKHLYENWIRSGFPMNSFETTVHSGPQGIRYFENTFIGNVKDNTLRGLWWLKRDISEKKRIEEEGIKAQKLESLGILAGGIAHDFNNLLTGLLGNLSLLENSPNLAPRENERLQAALRACTRARQLTHQLLTFSQGGSPIKKTSSICELLKDSIEFSLRGSNVGCQYRIPADLWALDIDQGQIHQVINNLVINAVQAMPSGGVIEVKASNIVVKRQTPISLPCGKYVRIAIKDSGIGIPADHIEKVFDPYFTTKAKGTGLGLATSYSVIRRHGGLMCVRSKVDVGSIFFFYLPASLRQAETETPQRRVSLTGSGRILLMDDDEMIREMAREMLVEMGYDVAVACDGAQAIEAYRQTHRTRYSFDAVIMDLTVPGGMGGREALQEIRLIDPDVKAVVSSGYSNDPVMADFIRHGFMAVLPKPYGAEDIADVLAGLLKTDVLK